MQEHIQQLKQMYTETHDPYRCSALKAAIVALHQPESLDSYTEWLENMTILLANAYQQTYDMLLEKMGNKESNLFLEMLTVQETQMVLTIEKISKLKANGTIFPERLEGHMNWLIDKYDKYK